MSNVRVIVSKSPIENNTSILEIAKHGAKMNFDFHGQVLPVTILFARRNFNTGEIYEDGSHIVMLEVNSFLTSNDKNNFAWAVKSIAQKSNASDLAFVSEAWLTIIDHTTKQQTKIEAVTITVESIYSEPEMWVAEIERVSDSARLKEFNKQEGFQLSIGRFAGLLPTRKFVS